MGAQQAASRVPTIAVSVASAASSSRVSTACPHGHRWHSWKTATQMPVDRAAYHSGLAQRGALRGELSQVLGSAAARGDQDGNACGPVGPLKPPLPRAQTEWVRHRRGSFTSQRCVRQRVRAP